MERVRQVTLAAGVVLALGGCMATDRLTANYHDAKRAVGLGPTGAPATQLSVIMQRRLVGLSDPTRPDQQQYGLPGQVFLIGADGKAAAADGDLVVTVTDETPRPAGQPPRTTEKWHFTPDVLTRLRVKDDRFGECYVLFLPWPAEWKDVTRVAVKANYRDKAAGAIELFAQEVTINLDLGDNVIRDTWEKLGAAKAAQQQQQQATQPPAFQPIPINPQVPSQQPGQLPPPTATPGLVVPPAQPAPTFQGVPQTIVVPRS